MEGGDRAVLLASRRRGSGVVRFPAERPELFDDACDIEPVELSTEGTLFTFTTQEFPPPDPYKGKREDFRPYITGYIELPDDGILVEGGLIVTADPGRLTIGQKMIVTPSVFFETMDGQSFLTYAFTPPVAESQSTTS